MFLHDQSGITHLLFNMLGLFFFGPRLEVVLGSRNFLLLYFVSGMVAAMVSFVNPFVSIIGASGAVYGVFMAFAYYWPRENIYIWGVIPVQARWMVVMMTAISLYGGLGLSMDNIAHFAHLGGFLGGFLFVKVLERRLRRVHEKRPVTPKVDPDRWKRIDRSKLHEVNRTELDRILQKIDTSGMESLTMRELEFLERFSSI
jgi:membrane associated rhomboid family serine protease